jgi:membrane-bound metal-dependent hydrolase YbcI (DUF457 family)
MFIGHFAAGFAAKRWAPRVSLGLLITAPLLLDVLWPFYALAGIEHFRIQAGGAPFHTLVFDSYPWSHSLLMAVVYGVLVRALYRWRTGDPRGANMLGALVVSHWILDWVTHDPDLPLWPGGPVTGLGLWRSVPGTVVVESVMFTAGVWLYLGATRSKDRIGAISLWAFLVFIVLLYAVSIVGPPPPVGAERLVSLTAMTFLIVLPIAWWIDKHRAASGFNE